MHPMLNIAVRAARAAGNIIARNLGQNDQFEVTEKRKDDLVTDVDRECEQTITSILLKSYRDHAVLGEEGGVQGNAVVEVPHGLGHVRGRGRVWPRLCNQVPVRSSPGSRFKGRMKRSRMLSARFSVRGGRCAVFRRLRGLERCFS